ncbi:MAG: hypothetical protein OXI46_05905 [Gemmatimonadota bacterium]|nr:hypothetical protein [Gemmatimonadota bacterium]
MSKAGRDLEGRHRRFWTYYAARHPDDGVKWAHEESHVLVKTPEGQNFAMQLVTDPDRVSIFFNLPTELRGPVPNLCIEKEVEWRTYDSEAWNEACDWLHMRRFFYRGLASMYAKLVPQACLHQLLHKPSFGGAGGMEGERARWADRTSTD